MEKATTKSKTSAPRMPPIIFTVCLSEEEVDTGEIVVCVEEVSGAREVDVLLAMADTFPTSVVETTLL